MDSSIISTQPKFLHTFQIIEGLLIMGELMDLGFSEGKVSTALARHEFNRDKALDELVS